ncbi:hypothetical protein [Streptomyces sp. NPDC088801]|uniref:hypothetical protein n=1 Tax=Streptomyces sp. NPDC088801 TaxID=3365903 RepID=UPI0038193C5D
MEVNATRPAWTALTLTRFLPHASGSAGSAVIRQGWSNSTWRRKVVSKQTAVEDRDRNRACAA